MRMLKLIIVKETISIWEGNFKPSIKLRDITSTKGQWETQLDDLPCL